MLSLRIVCLWMILTVMAGAASASGCSLEENDYCGSAAVCQQLGPDGYTSLIHFEYQFTGTPEANMARCTVCGLDENGGYWAWQWDANADSNGNVFSPQACRDALPPLVPPSGNGQTEPPADGGDPSNGGAGNPASPIFVSRVHQAFLTDLAGGVLFDIDADGRLENIAWPVAGNHGGFLCLDRDLDGLCGNGSEFFGNFTAQPVSDLPNGFAALRVFDGRDWGGNGDGVISAHDGVFDSLVIWVDADGDGFSKGELISLQEFGVESISLDYESRRHVHPTGAVARQWGLVKWSDGRADWDAVDWWFPTGGPEPVDASPFYNGSPSQGVGPRSQ